MSIYQDGNTGLVRAEQQSDYAQDVATLILQDAERLRECEDAIARDQQRINAIEAELRRLKDLENEYDKIRKRVDDNVKYKSDLKYHLPWRRRSLELLCADQGWMVPKLTAVPPVPAQGLSAASGGTPIGDALVLRNTGPQITLTDTSWLEKDK